jgi:hypothetical protein
MLGLEVKKIQRARMIAFYIVGSSITTLRNFLFIDLIDSIIEKTAVMTRTTTETEGKSGIKRCFGSFLSFFI